MRLEDRPTLIQRGDPAPVVSEAHQRALSDLAQMVDSSSIAPALLLLTDEGVSDAANWSLLVAAEAYDDADFVREFLIALPILHPLSPRWAEILMLRVLKENRRRLLLARQAVGAARAQKEAVDIVCTRILDKDSSQIDKAAAVIFASRI
jgi:hypothetical protein